MKKVTELTYHAQIKERNHKTIREFFEDNPTQIYSLTDLQTHLTFDPRTLKNHLKGLLLDGVVKIVFSKPKLKLYQFNPENGG